MCPYTLFPGRLNLTAWVNTKWIQMRKLFVFHFLLFTMYNDSFHLCLDLILMHFSIWFFGLINPIRMINEISIQENYWWNNVWSIQHFIFCSAHSVKWFIFDWIPILWLNKESWCRKGVVLLMLYENNRVKGQVIYSLIQSVGNKFNAFLKISVHWW